MIVLVFDTETTGLVDNLLVATDRQPEIIEFASILVDLDTGEIHHEYETLVRPVLHGGKLPEKIVKITGISQADVDGAKPFVTHAGTISGIIGSAPAVLGHNVRFDQDMVNIEFGRLSNLSPVMWPYEAICTSEQSAHYLGRRPSQSDLYEYLFQERFAGAHRAMVDVQALTRIAIEMRKRGDL